MRTTPVTPIIKLDANENPYGMCRAATEAVQLAQQTTARYPDETPLRRALAYKHRLAEPNVLLGNGSSEVLDIIARTFLDTKSEAICSDFSFMSYRAATESAGGRNIVVPTAGFGHDLPAMVAAVSPRTKIMWIANPNNPTGTFIPHDELKEALQKIPRRVVIVLDEAYFEYLHPCERADTTQWLRVLPNLIIVRTFSKIHGLAGLRVGYAFANPAIVRQLGALKPRFSVNAVGLAAAEQTLGDQDFVTENRRLNALGRKKLLQGLAAIGIPGMETHGNFVMCKVGDARAVSAGLQEQGIQVLPLTAYGLPEHIRISIGRPSEIAYLLEQLGAILPNVSAC